MEFIPYCFVFLFVFMIGVLDISTNSDANKKAFFGLVLVALVTLASFRSVGVGSDDNAYVEIFSKIPPVTSCESMLCGYDYSAINIEFGFFSLLSILSALGGGNIVLFGAVALLSIYFNLKAIRFFSPYFGASALVYFSHFFLAKELNAIRVGLATAIAFHAASYLCRNNRIAFLLFFVLAFSIHVSSVLVLIPAFLYVLAPGRVALAIVGGGGVFASSIINFPQMIDGLAIFGAFQEKINLYANAEEYNYALPLFDMVNLRNILVVVVCLVFWDRLSDFNDKFRLAFYFFFSAAFFRVLFGSFAIIAGRGYAAISMFEYIIIPFVAICFAGRLWGYFLVFIYSAVTLYLNLFVSSAWSGGVNFFNDFM